MKRTLGIDLGSNSLGWAVLDDVTGEIPDRGVVVFPEGVDPAKDSLETLAAFRRGKRMGRRLKFRRKIRKWALLGLLIDNGMCPMTREELAAWKKSGVYPVGNRAFVDWLKSTDLTNPYADRAAAASGPVEPLVLGRALYHICQRRGFKSNRKAPDADEIPEADEADETPCEKPARVKPARGKAAKDQGKVQAGIAELDAEIRAAGCKTLGQYFAKVIDEQKALPAKRRVRARYTDRTKHYEVEFAAIMDAQRVAPELREKLHEAIFHQRPLRSQAHLVGNCPLEPKNPRCRVSHPAFEEFRMLAFVNNLSFESAEDPDRRIALSNADRAEACAAFFVDKPSIKFGDITKKSKHLKALFKANPSWKFHYYRDGQSVAACPISHRIRSGFGEVAYDEQKVFDALTDFDDDARLADWFRRHYPALTDRQVARLVGIRPAEGYAKYSLKAIRKMLPFLRKGLQLSDARLMARLPDVLPDFAVREEAIWTRLQELQSQYRAERDAKREGRLAKAAVVRPYLDRCRDYFVNELGLDERQWNSLYLRGDAAYEADPNRPGRVPKVELGMIRNPLVQRSMTVLRRLVNYLADHGKIDRETTIRIELARSVNDYATRTAIKHWQEKREAERAKARAALGANATEETVDRYILWQEQDETCLYTGNPIEQADLLAGTAFDIEHTIPRSRSGDDSLANKTLCDVTYNRQVKQGRIPTECPNYDEIDTRLKAWREKLADLEQAYDRQTAAARRLTDPEAKSNARVKAIETRLERDYWRDKLRRFTIAADRLTDPEAGLGGFKRRQLVDTGIMCSHAVELLGSVYQKPDGSGPNVYAVNGAATAFARKAWGLQGDEGKDRSNHVHHAKDAMVIAALKPTRFNAICAALKDDGRTARVRECDVCPPPFPNFAETVRRACDDILIKHVVRNVTLKPSSKRTCLANPHPDATHPGKTVKHVLSRGDTVRGALHKDTFYGCIVNPESGEKAFVVRKPLSGPIADMLKMSASIVDPAIREIVKRRLEELKAEGRKTVEPGDVTMPSGVPVNRVRIVAHTTNPAELRDHDTPSAKPYKTPYYVTAAEGSNFRLALFCKNGKWTFEPDNSLAWAKEHKRPDYVPLHARENFVGYVLPGSLALAYENSPDELKTLSVKDLSKRLYKVVKFDNTGRVTFRLHSEARAAVDLGKDLVQVGKRRDGQSQISFGAPHELLCLSPSTYYSHMLFEGIHFKMALDGTITFR